MDIHAGVYGRQSDKREDGSEVSTIDQRENGIAEAKRRGAKHIRVYEDLGISAFKDGVERKDFNRLIADCRSGQINMIVVYYISRLSRKDPTEILPVLMDLLNIGVTIVSVNEGEFRRDNLGDLISLIVRLDGAHKESMNKSVAVSGAKRKARSLGGYVGGTAPYGFRLVPESRLNPADGKPITIQVPYVDEKEAAVIAWVWSEIRAHMNTVFTAGKSHPGSISGLAARMNDRSDMPTRGQTNGKARKGSRWEPRTLKRILIDPRIAGFAAECVYGISEETGEPTKYIESYRILRDPETSEPLRFADPIIPPDEWYELQAWVATRGRGRGRSYGQTLLSGLRTPDGTSILVCECARTMCAASNAQGRKSPSYTCSRKPGGALPGEHSGGNAVVQSALNEYVARCVFALIQTGEEDPETADVIREATRRFGAFNEPVSTAQERSLLLAERADAVRGLEELYDERDAGGFRSEIGRRRFLKSESTLTARMESAEARLRDIGEASSPSLPLNVWLPADSDADPMGEGSWWHSASVTDRREFIALFVDRVVITKAASRGRYGRIEDRVSIEFVHEREDEYSSVA